MHKTDEIGLYLNWVTLEQEHFGHNRYNVYVVMTGPQSPFSWRDMQRVKARIALRKTDFTLRILPLTSLLRLWTQIRSNNVNLAIKILSCLLWYYVTYKNTEESFDQNRNQIHDMRNIIHRHLHTHIQNLLWMVVSCHTLMWWDRRSCCRTISSFHSYWPLTKYQWSSQHFCVYFHFTFGLCRPVQTTENRWIIHAYLS
jgi:hypothetical protein